MHVVYINDFDTKYIFFSHHLTFLNKLFKIKFAVIKYSKTYKTGFYVLDMPMSSDSESESKKFKNL